MGDGGGRRSGSSNLVFLKMLLGLIVTVGFACLLLIGTLEHGTMKREEMIGKGKLVHNSELDLNYYMMSKRKVPNGPDPIHNRRAGNSGRPPGQA